MGPFFVSHLLTSPTIVQLPHVWAIEDYPVKAWVVSKIYE
jgi:hypothetical protein